MEVISLLQPFHYAPVGVLKSVHSVVAVPEETALVLRAGMIFRGIRSLYGDNMSWTLDLSKVCPVASLAYV